mgnify:CR=1 FL=1
MNSFVPFRAIRYNLEKVKLAEVATPPYDVISSEEREKFYQMSPHNMVRLDFSKPLPAAKFEDWLEQSGQQFSGLFSQAD